MILDQHEVRLTVDGVELDPLENTGTITLDRAWSPFVQGRLSVRPPADFDHTAPGKIIMIELTQRFGDVAFVSDLTELWCGPGRTLADLTAEVCGPGRDLDDLTAETITAGSWNTPARAGTGRTLQLVVVSRSRTRDEHTLQVASIEALIADWVWYGIGTNLEFYAETLGTYIDRVLGAHYSSSMWFDIPFEDWPVLIPDDIRASSLTTTAHVIEPMAASTSTIIDLLRERFCRLYSRGDLALLAKGNGGEVTGTPTVEHGVNLIDWTVDDEREVGILVRWTGTATDPLARPIDSSYAFPELQPPHEFALESTGKQPTTSGFSSGVAPGLAEGARRRIGLDRSPVRLVTVNDYSMEPEQTITYTLPDETAQEDLIDSITWQLGGQWESDIWI